MREYEKNLRISIIMKKINIKSELVILLLVVVIILLVDLLFPNEYLSHIEQRILDKEYALYFIIPIIGIYLIFSKKDKK